MDVVRKGDLSQSDIEQWLYDLRGNPYAPDSSYDVTTLIRASLGDADDFWFVGVNSEVKEYRLGTHGEEGAIAAMIAGLGKYARIEHVFTLGAMSGESKPSEDPSAYVNAASCWNCRQRQVEFAVDSEVEVSSLSLNGRWFTYKLGDRFQSAFSFNDYSPEVARERNKTFYANPPSLETVAQRLTRTSAQSKSGIFSWLSDLESFDFKSKTSQSVVLRFANQAYTAGVKVEDAAFVGTTAFQGAVAIGQAAFGYQPVMEAWMLSSGRGEKKYAPDVIEAPTGGSMQVLLDHGAAPDMPLYLFTPSQDHITLPLKAVPYVASTFKRPTVSVSEMKTLLEQ